MPTKIIRTGTTDIIIHERERPDPAQLSIFDIDYKERWYAETIEIAKAFHRPFWPSELRAKCAIAPDHDNMWGQLFRKLKKHGFKMTGQFRKSNRDSRRGSIEFQWEQNHV